MDNKRRKNTIFATMKLQTKVEIEPFERRMDYSSKIVAIGSCFADRVGHEMQRSKLRAEVNPLGVLFNPLSIASSLDRLAECRLMKSGELIEGESGSELPWYSFEVHSSLLRPTREESLQAINTAIEQGHKALKAADWVVITLGTAWVYELNESGRVVANCHRRPARDFSRRRLSVEQVVEALSSVIEGALNGKNILLTVSPIRHVGDGLVENSLSKATLRLAVAELCERFEQVSYFPAYEIVMDELRDYRFYDQDMVHIAPVAVEYIWERFAQAVLSEEAQQLLPRVMQVVRASEHRAVNPSSEAHQKFAKSQLRAIENLSQVEFSEEIAKFEDILKINL